MSSGHKHEAPKKDDHGDSPAPESGAGPSGPPGWIWIVPFFLAIVVAIVLTQYGGDKETKTSNSSSQGEVTTHELSACEIDSRAVRYPFGPDGCVSKHLGWARWWPVDGPMSVHYPKGKGSHVEDICKPGPPLALYPGVFKFCRNSPNSWGVAILER